jgi:hypothetical protein
VIVERKAGCPISHETSYPLDSGGIDAQIVKGSRGEGRV